MSDFSDRPFVAGSLIGLRAFSLDRYGRLYGPSFDQVFKPGENEATCRKGESGARMTFGGITIPMSAFMPSSAALSSSFSVSEPRCPCGCGMPVSAMVNRTEHSDAEMVEVKVKHTLAGVDCTCGFYAYFDGGNDYKEPHNIGAVIEGYGVCTVGDRGFRASKARLVALVEPKARVPKIRAEYLRRNYPDVPVYPNKRAALEAHPLTLPESPSPQDDDFWSKAVAR